MHQHHDLTFEECYSPDIAQSKYRQMLKEKGRKAKLKDAEEFIEYVEFLMLNYKYSPQAVLYAIKSEGMQFEIEVKSVNTIYKGIEKGYFPNLKLEHLPRKRKGKKRQVQIQARANKGTSIEKRPDISQREEFGHWEMDTVKGMKSNKKCLLVLTERKTRYEVIEPMKACNTDEVRKALNRIEKRIGSIFYTIFNSISVDNGCEFQDYISMEKALYRKGKRCEIYYCHPYAPHERGTNENNNLLIRRFFHKGSDFDLLLEKRKIKWVEQWLNDYPRTLFNGLTAWDKFKEELIKLGIRPLRI